MEDGSFEEAGQEDREGVRPDDGAVRLPVTLYEDCKYIEEDGVKHLASIQGVLSVLPDGETKVFMRNAKRVGAGDGKLKSHIRVLVGELDGVRVYVIGTKVIMTRQDLYF